MTWLLSTSSSRFVSVLKVNLTLPVVSNCAKIAAAFEEAANKRRPAKQLRSAIPALQKEITGKEILTHSLRRFSGSWLETKRPEVEPAAWNFHSGTIMKFIIFPGEKADDEIAEISKDETIAFLNHEATTVASKTVKHDLKCLRMLFRSAKEHEIVSVDPPDFENVAEKSKPATRIPFAPDQLPEVPGVVRLVTKTSCAL
jgi:hypothetical protein